MMKALALASIITLATSASAAAQLQDPYSAADAGTIRGRITGSDTGRPLRRARVSIVSAAESSAVPPIVATTNSLGAFDARNVPPGLYYLQASRAGYLTTSYGQRRARDRGVLLEVKPRQVVERIDVVLPRPCVIGGIVTDDLGEPYPGVRVEALEMRYRLGKRVPFPVALSTTDDEGRFRLSGLLPGSYQVVATSSETWRTEKRESLGYASTAFPGVGEPQLIALGPSQSRTDLHIPLLVGRTARITGRVIPAAGRPQPTQVTLAYSHPGSIVVAGMRSVRTDGEGAFAFDDVPGGVYSVTAGGGSERIVTVAGADIDDVVLTPRVGSTVTGSVVTEDGGPPPFTASGVRVLLAAPDEKVLPTVRVNAVDSNWSFKLSNLGGNFLFRLRGLPDDWMLASVQIEDKEIADQPFDVPTGGKEIAGLKLVITQKVGTISGDVLDGAGRGTPSATVILFADDPELWMPGSRFVRTIRPGVDGRFAITGLPAGTYRAAAREFIEDGQWEDVAFLKALRDTAMRVVLTPGDTQKISVKLPNPNER